MPKKTFRLTTREHRKLATIRLKRNLTFNALADEIGGVARGTVLRVLSDPKAEVHETTIYQIREYLQNEAGA
jgi:hypothetical protein